MSRSKPPDVTPAPGIAALYTLGTREALAQYTALVARYGHELAVLTMLSRLIAASVKA